MKMKGTTLHFINRIDETNCGDMFCTPLLYYYDFFKQYRICRHDIRYIDYDAIAPEDVVILGGGGLLNYSEALNRNINRVLDTGACVIAWAPGFNTHTEYSSRLRTEINFSRFAIVSVRDFQNSAGLPYLPDVTCKIEALRKEYTIKRTIGIARHKDYPISQFSYDEITNREPMEKIVEFIGESEVILSNSFHMIYWAMLMGKKTICIEPFSNKFFAYQHKPAYYTAEKSLDECIQQAPVHDVLEDYIQRNEVFFQRVKQLIQAHLIPCAEDQVYDSVTREALVYGKLRETQLIEGDSFSSELFLDTGEGFNEGQKLIAIDNVFGDKTHTAEFDLSAYPTLHSLRFDPLERQFCQIQILDAVSGAGPVTLIPSDSSQIGGWDRFLTTDPQYFIHDPCNKFLRIHFRMELMPHYVAEQTIKGRLWQEGQEKNRLTEALQSKEREVAEERQEHSRLAESLCRVTETLQIREREAAEERKNTDSLRECLEQRNAQCNELQYRLEDQRRAAQVQEQELQRRGAEIESQKERLGALQTTLENAQQTVISMLHSRSWRITAPLRAVTTLIKNILKRG